MCGIPPVRYIIDMVNIVILPFKIILFSIVFTYHLIQHGSDRVRTTPKHNQIHLAGDVTLNTSPFGVGVIFKCWYLTTVSVDTTDYAVEPATIIGEATNTGSLADGFTLTVGPTPIILGKIATVTATWSVQISVLSFHFETCAVTHGATSINIIQVNLYDTGKI